MKKTSERPSGELVFGIHPICEILRAKRRRLISLYTTKPTPKGWQEIEKLLPSARSLPIQYVSRDKLTAIAGTIDHQGVVAWAQPLPMRKMPFDPKRHPFLMVLDGIQDPRNLGAIIRTAYCTGVNGIVLVKKNAAPLNATALKASAGLAEHLEVYVAPSIQDAVQTLRTAGYTIYIATFGGQDARQCAYQSPCCIVVGSEGSGVTKSIERFGTSITLPQRTTDSSYNASVAAGIIMFLVAQHIGVLSTAK